MTAAPVMSITEELVAELERELAWSDKRSAEILAALLAERAELKQKYRWLQKVTPYRFKKMQDASTTDGGDVLYFHESRFDIEVHAAMQAAQ